ASEVRLPTFGRSSQSCARVAGRRKEFGEQQCHRANEPQAIFRKPRGSWQADWCETNQPHAECVLLRDASISPGLSLRNQGPARVNNLCKANSTILRYPPGCRRGANRVKWMAALGSPGLANNPIGSGENSRRRRAQPNLITRKAVMLGKHPENPAM